jgi:hypothetical protein
MDDPFGLDADARAYLELFLEEFANIARYPLSLKDLVERWATLVREVEEGYADSIFEYANDVAIRDLLRTIETDGPSNLASSLRDYLEPLDRRFFMATNDTSRSIPGLVEMAGNPWRSRIPKNPSGELLNDLRRAGLRI